MGSERQAKGPIPWVLSQLGHFLGDGYSEIRALISLNTPHNVKKLFSGSLLALILALLAVGFIASQIHPVAIVLAVACVLLIVYGRRLFQRLALFAGYFLCGFILFIGAGLIVVVPVEKEYPLIAKAIAVFLFVALCLLMPSLLAMRPRQAIAVGWGSETMRGAEMKSPALTFADVGGLEEAKQQIREMVRANLDSKRFSQYGIFRNGILLHGPRGTGKTFVAEAIAGEFNLRYLYVSASSLVHKYIGDTLSEIDRIFDDAEANRPSMIFIDEIDALGARRQQIGDMDDPGGAARAYNSYTARLMTRIDNAHKSAGVIVVAATNFYDGLDRALIREGRFDLHIRLDLPNEEERARILQAQLAKRPAASIETAAFARRSPDGAQPN